MAVKTSKPLEFEFDFYNPRHACRVERARALKKWISELALDQFYLAQEGKTLVARPAAGLTPCSKPDTTTFQKYVQEASPRQHSVHFRTVSGKSRLVVPKRYYAHIGCFAREASEAEFLSLVRMVHCLVKRHAKKRDISIFTHGHDVGHLHVKLQPDPIQLS